jgi:hypothetical protein
LKRVFQLIRGLSPLREWYLWHGNVFQALNELQSLEMDLDAAAFESKNENSQKLLKGVEELHTYVELLDEEWENTFRRWYPDFRPRAQAKKAA